jgi:membrane-associated protease RseP (regulator of RpoE activity)
MLVELTVFLALWASLLILGRYTKLGRMLEVKPFLLIYKTKRFNDVFRFVSKKYKKLWIFLGNVSVVIAVIAIVYGLWFFTNNLLHLLYLPEKAAPVILLLPFITISLESLPYFLIAISIIVIVHEGAHAILMNAERIKVKSAGILVFLAFLGAFVEEDREEMKRAKTSSRLRIYAVGSASNIIMALVMFPFLLNFNYLTSPFYHQGVPVGNVIEGGPAQLAGIRAGDVIISIDNVPTPSYYEFSKVLQRIEPGDSLHVTLHRQGSYLSLNVVTGTHPENTSRAYLGVKVTSSTYYVAKYALLPNNAPFHIYVVLFLTSLLSLFIGLINLLPMAPLDGDAILTTALERVTEKRNVKCVRYIFTSLTLMLIASNLVLTFMRLGLAML